MTIFVSIIVILLLVYTFLVRGRKGHPELNALRGWAYAHRGLHGDGIPENSMAAFRNALEAGYGIELDVHLLKDGSVAVMHDFDLARTTGGTGKIEDLTEDQLANYRLEGTEETIPTFREVLELYAGKAPLIIELKALDGNHAALCEAACKAMEGYTGPWCMESFDPRCIRWLRLHRPDIIRGQLTENFMAAKENPLHPVLKFGITHQLGNFLILPDFVAYKFADRKTLGNFLVRKIWGVAGVTWTLKTVEEFEAAVNEGWIPIFEGFRP